MIHGLVYISREKEGKWDQFVESHNLTPVLVSGSVLDYIEKKIDRLHKEDLIDMDHYLIDGTSVKLVHDYKDSDKVLVFKSNTSEGLGKTISKFHLKIPKKKESSD